MSYADVVTQMQTIQTRLAQLGMLPPTAARTGSATSAASFATALDGASATTTVSPSATASTDGALVSPNGATGDDVVQAALAYKGVPYVLGGESTSGIDCSGLVQAALSKVGVTAPRLVHQQETIGQKVDSLKDAKPGDLIVLSGGDHIAIWMGNGTAIHAPYPGRSVSVQKAWFDDSDVTTIRRVVPATGDGTTGAAAIPPISAAAATATPVGGTTSSGLSAATVAKATSMLTTYGGDVGLYDAAGLSSSGGTSLSSLLASFGLTGTSTASATSSSSSSSAQQILAARTALLGAGA